MAIMTPCTQTRPYGAHLSVLQISVMLWCILSADEYPWHARIPSHAAQCQMSRGLCCNGVPKGHVTVLVHCRRNKRQFEIAKEQQKSSRAVSRKHEAQQREGLKTTRTQQALAEYAALGGDGDISDDEN